MNSQNSVQSKERDSGHAGLKVVLALFVLVGLMVASYFYPYPSGQRPDILGLLIFWGREALTVLAALVVLVFIALVAIVKAARKRGGSDA